MKGLTILTVVFLSVFSAESAFTEPWRKGMNPGDGMPAYSESTLHLSQEQSDQIQRIHGNYLQEITRLYYRLFSRQAEVSLLWAEPDPDPEKIMAREQEISQIQGQLKEKAIRYQLDCRSVLTKEQKARLTSDSAWKSPGHGPGLQRR